MSIKLVVDGADITKAVTAHINSLGINTEGRVVDISYAVSRKGGAGISADVRILTLEEAADEKAALAPAVAAIVPQSVEPTASLDPVDPAPVDAPDSTTGVPVADSNSLFPN